MRRNAKRPAPRNVIAIPKPFLVIYLFATLILNVLGLASIVDGAHIWLGFLTGFVRTYQQFLRDPILQFVLFFWPSNWGRIPPWAIDILIIQGSFFISYRLFMYFESRTTLLTFTRFPFVQSLLVFVGGPLAPFVQLTRYYFKAMREVEMAAKESDEGEEAEGQFQKYGSTNLPLLSELGWQALVKRELAGLWAAQETKSAFIRINIYYVCYALLVITILFIGYQTGR